MKINPYQAANIEILREGENGGGGGSVPITQPGGGQQQQQQQQQQNPPENNGGVNEEIFDTLWEDEKKTTPENNGGNPPQNQPDNQRSAGDEFNNYVESLNFSDGIEMDTIVQDLQQGDHKSFQGALSKAGQNAYKKAMVDSHKMIKESVSKAVNDAVGKARGHTQADMAIREMNSKLPYTKDKALAPVAEGVLKRFMEKGQDFETALGSVDKYFRRTGELVGGKPGRTRQQGFGNGVDNSHFNDNDDEPAEIDFMNILTQKDDED